MSRHCRRRRPRRARTGTLVRRWTCTFYSSSFSTGTSTNPCRGSSTRSGPESTSSPVAGHLRPATSPPRTVAVLQPQELKVPGPYVCSGGDGRHRKTTGPPRLRSGSRTAGRSPDPSRPPRAPPEPDPSEPGNSHRQGPSPNRPRPLRHPSLSTPPDPRLSILETRVGPAGLHRGDGRLHDPRASRTPPEPVTTLVHRHNPGCRTTLYKNEVVSPKPQGGQGCLGWGSQTHKPVS